MRGDSLGEPWLGVDLDETYIAGDPVTVSGLLMEIAPGEQTSFWVTAQVVAHLQTAQSGRVRIHARFAPVTQSTLT